MSGISTIAPTEAPKPVETRQPPDRDSRRQPRRRPPKPEKSELFEAEPHKLDLEA